MAVRLEGQEFGGVARDHWRRRNEELDPAVDFVEIYANLLGYEYPWDFVQTLSRALFRTYAVPEIGALLDGTGEFTARTQKRHDDTGLLLEPPGRVGFADPETRTAIRRINQMHRAYDIPDDQLRYVLATFVVVPKRWIDDFGERPLTSGEVQAVVEYYRALGQRMAIPAIPATYAESPTPPWRCLRASSRDLWRRGPTGSAALSWTRRCATPSATTSRPPLWSRCPALS